MSKNAIYKCWACIVGKFLCQFNCFIDNNILWCFFLDEEFIRCEAQNGEVNTVDFIDRKIRCCCLDLFIKKSDVFENFTARRTDFLCVEFSTENFLDYMLSSLMARVMGSFHSIRIA